MLMTLLSPIAGLIFVGISLAAPAPTPARKTAWGFDVWQRSTSSSEDVAPPSTHNKLKYEVAEIVGAYLIWLLFTGLAIVIVGKRLRRKQQSSNHTLGMQMIQPAGKVTLREIEAGPRYPTGPLSPKSPGRMMNLKSWAMGHSKSKHSDASISTNATMVDNRVVDEDKSRNMDEMAKLYAAVMARDEERSSNQARSSAGSSPVINDSPVTPKSPLYPSTMAHPAYIPPTSPQLYQPSHYEPMPPPPVPMENDEQQLLADEPTPRKSKNAGLSILSSSRLGSTNTSKARPSPITVRGQPISKPLGSADLRQSTLPSAGSISSSVYSPGPPPPTPGKLPAPIAEEIEMHGRPQLTSLSSSNSTTQAKSLPFRQYQEALKSAPATKTTFLDRRTSAMNGPKTGVPKTPYSPYCPQTPMTPVTPRRLLNKEELKKNKKQYAMKVVAENDLVQSDQDMWGTD